MRFLERLLMTIVATLTMAVSAASAATAVSYSGNWPLRVTQTQFGNQPLSCLTLTDNGSLGWPHSGPASLRTPGSGFSGSATGTFQLIDNLLVATIQSQSSGNGMSAGLVYIGPASNGNIGNGTFDNVFGGRETVSGVLQFGPKGGC